MHARRVTQLEVARRAGVSRTTASFVLSGRDDMRISPEVRERVLHAARTLDYRPNLMARALRTKITHTIALISDTIVTEPYAGHFVRGALAAATRHGHVVLLGETEGDAAVERRVVENFLDRQVDGFIYASMYTREARVPAQLLGQRLVMLNCMTGDADIPAVIPDEANAGRTAARALLDAGHRDAIYLVGEPAPHVFAGRERVAGVEDELVAHGTVLAGTIPCGWDPSLAYEAVRAFLTEGGRPAALICLNDRIALGTYQALGEAGIGVPGGASVVSFDDSELASWLLPGLTSVAIPHVEMGRAAVDALLLRDRALGVRRIDMPLKTRGSIRPTRP